MTTLGYLVAILGSLKLWHLAFAEFRRADLRRSGLR
jgi:hypothetical protein